MREITPEDVKIIKKIAGEDRTSIEETAHAYHQMLHIIEKHASVERIYYKNIKRATIKRTRYDDLPTREAKMARVEKECQRSQTKINGLKKEILHRIINSRNIIREGKSAITLAQAVRYFEDETGVEPIKPEKEKRMEKRCRGPNCNKIRCTNSYYYCLLHFQRSREKEKVGDIQ